MSEEEQTQVLPWEDSQVSRASGPGGRAQGAMGFSLPANKQGSLRGTVREGSLGEAGQCPKEFGKMGRHSTKNYKRASVGRTNRPDPRRRKKPPDPPHTTPPPRSWDGPGAGKGLVSPNSSLRQIAAHPLLKVSVCHSHPALAICFQSLQGQSTAGPALLAPSRPPWGL